MRLTKMETISRHRPDGFICSVCKTKYEEDDWIEEQASLHWTNHCGYGSVFGDGNTVNLDMCQTCVSRILGVYLEVKENYFE